MSTPTKHDRFPWLLVGLALAALGLLTARFWFLTDDAYISFRYARNLVEGHGLVWNPGTPPVEGYSNLGWVLVLAATSALGAAPELASRLLSALAAGATLLMLVRFLRRGTAAQGPIAGAPRAGYPLPGDALAGGVLFLATLPLFAVWTSGGLETAAFTLALFALHASLADVRSSDGERRWPVLPALFATGAAVLLRADGAAWVVLVLVAGSLGRGPRRWRARAACLLAAAVVVAAQLAFRHSTYGDWLPNTVRAKVSWSQLPNELRGAFLQRGAFYVLANTLAVPSLLVAFLLGLRAHWRQRSSLPAIVVVVGTAGYCVLVGGDFMTFGRFLVPALPFLAVLFANGLATLPAPLTRRVAIAATLALSLLAAWDISPFPRSVRDRFHYRWNDRARAVSEVEMWANMRARTHQLVTLGRALALHTTPAEVACYGPVGAIGYHSRHTIHDLYGLTSRELLARSTLGKELRSPGHDRRVAPTELRDIERTYLDATVVPVGTPRPALPAGSTLRWEEYPLDASAGLPAEHVLRILRP